MGKLIGMLGPINVADFREYLNSECWHDDLPKGLGGTPVNLLSIELIKKGYQLVIFTLDPLVLDEVVLNGPNLRICIGPFRPKRARDLFSIEREYLLKAVKREKPSILHAHWTYEYALAAQKSKIPYIITAHDAPINVLRHNFIPYRIVRTIMAYMVLIRAKRVVSVSPYVADHLRSFMFYYGPKEVIPNGMPKKHFDSIKIRSSKETHTTFATILPGWGGLKNSRAAIEAFAIHRKSRPNDKLIMFGHGHGQGESAETWATARNITDGIEFSGHTPYSKLMERILGEVDILIHPSLEEAQPMVLIEAMALGIPVIGGLRSGGVPWTLDHGKAGLLVNVSSAKEISQAMIRLVSDEKLCIDIGEKGRELAFHRFHINVIVTKYEIIYQKLFENMEENFG